MGQNLPFSEMMRSGKCFPHMSNMLTQTYSVVKLQTSFIYELPNYYWNPPFMYKMEVLFRWCNSQLTNIARFINNMFPNYYNYLLYIRKILFICIVFGCRSIKFLKKIQIYYASVLFYVENRRKCCMDISSAP